MMEVVGVAKMDGCEKRVTGDGRWRMNTCREDGSEKDVEVATASNLLQSFETLGASIMDSAWTPLAERISLAVLVSCPVLRSDHA